MCVTTSFFNTCRGCVCYDDIFQTLQRLCALRRHSSITPGAVCVTTAFFNPCRGYVRYDAIFQPLQGLCALRRHSSAIVSCYEGTFQPTLVPVTDCACYEDIPRSLQCVCATKTQSSGIAGCAMGVFVNHYSDCALRTHSSILANACALQRYSSMIRRGVFLR